MKLVGRIESSCWDDRVKNVGCRMALRHNADAIQRHAQFLRVER